MGRLVPTVPSDATCFSATKPSKVTGVARSAQVASNLAYASAISGAVKLIFLLSRRDSEGEQPQLSIRRPLLAGSPQDRLRLLPEEFPEGTASCSLKGLLGQPLAFKIASVVKNKFALARKCRFGDRAAASHGWRLAN